MPTIYTEEEEKDTNTDIDCITETYTPTHTHSRVYIWGFGGEEALWPAGGTRRTQFPNTKRIDNGVTLEHGMRH